MVCWLIWACRRIISMMNNVAFRSVSMRRWICAVATFTGLIAKENVVSTFGVLYHFAGELAENGDEIWTEVAADYTRLSAYSFMIFNLLCAPCFAAMGAIRREMNNGKWTWAAIGYMCGFAYVVSLIVYQLGSLFTGNANVFGVIVALIALAAVIYLLVRKNQYDESGNHIKTAAR